MLNTLADRAVDTGIQHRNYDISEFEFRDEGSNGFTFEGVASVVDTPYSVRDQMGEFTETIRAGAFNKTLRDSNADVALFVNHDTRAAPLATRGAGSLQLTADPHLRVTAQLDPARPDVQVIRSAVSRGEMRQMSIGFQVPKARDQWSNDYTERTISEVILSETSIVWRGASPTTSGSMRWMEDVQALDGDDLRRAMRTLEARFDDPYADDVRSRLSTALRDRLTPSMGEYVWVRDFTDNYVVFEIDGGAQPGTFGLSYSMTSGSIVLSADDPVTVALTSKWEPIQRSADLERLGALLKMWDHRATPVAV